MAAAGSEHRPAPTTMPPPASAEGRRLSFRLLDAAGTVLAEQEPHHRFYAASTIKLCVLLAALRAAERGELDLAATVPATRTVIGADGAPFTLEGDHLDPTHPPEGTPVEVRELLVRMIDRSSNEATNTVIALVGLEAIGRLIGDLGLTDTRVERAIGDASAIGRGLTNETTAADLATTMRATVSGDAVSRASTALALDALRAQRIRVITTVVREGVPAGSKSGEVDGFRHDVAFIGDPSLPDARVLAVMTSGYAPLEADREIRRIARELLGDLAA